MNVSKFPSYSKIDSMELKLNYVQCCGWRDVTQPVTWKWSKCLLDIKEKRLQTLYYITPSESLRKFEQVLHNVKKKRNNSCEYFKLEKLLYQFVRIKQTTFIFSRRIVKKQKKNNFSDSLIRLQYLKHHNRKFDYGLNSNWNSN